MPFKKPTETEIQMGEKKKVRVKRTLKKIKKNKKKIISSFKFVSNKMTNLLETISKNIKINSIGRHMLYLKVNNPDKYAKIKTLGDNHFEKIKNGDKQTIKDMEKKIENTNISDILEYEGDSWTASDYLKASIGILLLAYLYTIFRWNYKFGKSDKKYCP